jgi:hypothetical protein
MRADDVKIEEASRRLHQDRISGLRHCVSDRRPGGGGETESLEGSGIESLATTPGSVSSCLKKVADFEAMV